MTNIVAIIVFLILINIISYIAIAAQAYNICKPSEVGLEYTNINGNFYKGMPIVLKYFIWFLQSIFYLWAHLIRLYRWIRK